LNICDSKVKIFSKNKFKNFDGTLIFLDALFLKSLSRIASGNNIELK
jgi:hypothetical protein